MRLETTEGKAFEGNIEVEKPFAESVSESDIPPAEISVVPKLESADSQLQSGVKRPAVETLTRPITNVNSNSILPLNDPNYPSKRPRIVDQRDRRREDEEREREIFQDDRGYDRERDRKRDEREREDARMRDKERERNDKELDRKREGKLTF